LHENSQGKLEELELVDMSVTELILHMLHSASICTTPYTGLSDSMSVSLFPMAQLPLLVSERNGSSSID